MIIRFSVANYLSFRELTDFNMVPGDIRTKKNHIEMTTLGIDILKFSLIYGPNGAGKSNLLRAIECLRDVILEKKENYPTIRNTHRLAEDAISKPTLFEIEFITESSNAYIYGVSILKEEITNEYLYISGLGKANDKLIFERNRVEKDKSEIQVDKKFAKLKSEQSFIDVAARLLKDQDLALTNYQKFDDELPALTERLTEVYKWFEYNLRFIYPGSKPVNFLYHLSNEASFLGFSNELLRSMDLGIESLEIKQYPIDEYFGKEEKVEIERLKKDVDDTGVYNWKFDVIALKIEENYIIRKLFVKHKGCDALFSMIEESDGTRRLIEYLTLINEILNPDSKAVWIIDEFERSIHPSLLKGLLRKLVNSENITGQLIFTTHECNLMDLEMFRQDEIWLTEKDESGSTQFSVLSDFKIRNDLDIQRGYLKGRFEAIPFLGNLEDLKWHKYATN